MDPKYTGEMFRHLEKQSEVLTSTKNSLSHELEKLQVEEEMLMRKYYEVMHALGVTKKNKDGEEVHSDAKNGYDKALVMSPPDE